MPKAKAKRSARCSASAAQVGQRSSTRILSIYTNVPVQHVRLSDDGKEAVPLTSLAPLPSAIDNTLEQQKIVPVSTETTTTDQLGSLNQTEPILLKDVTVPEQKLDEASTSNAVTKNMPTENTTAATPSSSDTSAGPSTSAEPPAKKVRPGNRYGFGGPHRHFRAPTKGGVPNMPYWSRKDPEEEEVNQIQRKADRYILFEDKVVEELKTLCLFEKREFTKSKMMKLGQRVAKECNLDLDIGVQVIWFKRLEEEYEDLYKDFWELHEDSD